MVETRSGYRILVQKVEVKRPVDGHRCRWEDKFNMDIKETSHEGSK